VTLVAGSLQTAELDTPFVDGLAVALANTDGCPVSSPVAGTPVTFTAPPSGPSGRFSGSATSAVTIGSDASGSAAAPTFTANDTAGRYTVTASSAYGSVSFSLTNTAAGIAVRIAPLAPSHESAVVTHGYADLLRARVLDADGNPVAGATVSFTLGSNAGGSSPTGSSGAGSATAGGSFEAGANEADATTDSAGIASSPRIVANSAAGAFTATASTPGIAATAGFKLRNLAGPPVTVTAGAAASESAAVRARFPIRLAVTVTDAEQNPVAGALVTFSAPARGPSGVFASGRRTAGHRTASVRTNSSGVAIAPALRASARPGGYIVRAKVRRAKSTVAFALVNEPAGQAP
jgi:protocatechuate 3,4-dioxygenase beta subunit